MKELILKIFILSLLLQSIATADDNLWTTDGPYNAKVQALAINPLNSNQILLGTVEDGLYKSDNGGDSWTHIDSDAIMHTAIRTIEYHPLGPDTIFCGTADCLFRSNNNGADWERVELPIEGHYDIYAITIHPTMPNIVFTTGPLLEWTLPNYKSIDGGRTWEVMSLNTVVAHDFIVDPLDDSTIYAVTQSGRSRKSILRSDDLGETWENIHRDLDTNLIVYRMAIDAVDNNIMYVCGRNGTEEASSECVYKSIDRAASWINITPPGLYYCWVLDICISPSDHNTIFVCTIADGVLRSTDGGENWTIINTGLAVRQTKAITCDEETGALYLGTYYGGAYRSISNGDIWEKISENITNTYCTDLAINSQTSDELYVCSWFGLYKLTNGQDSWEFIDMLYPDYMRYLMSIAIDPQDSKNIFIGIGYDMGFKRSLDGGNTWEHFDDGCNSGVYPYELEIGCYSDERKIISSTSSGLYISDDYGESWYLHEDIPQIYLPALDICPGDNGHILAGGYGLYESSDSGQSFNEITIPANDGYVSDIAYHPSNPDIFYICVFTEGILKTVDGGDSWENINNNLPIYSYYKKMSGIAINSLNPDNIFVSADHYGVYQSHDGGDSWEEFNEGLDTYYSNSHIIIDPNDTSRVILATDLQSVWTITRTATGIEDNVIALPSSVNLGAYPNPFNAATRITFNTNAASNIKADIYDVLGRHVVNIVNEYLYPGYHSVVWKPEAISTGQYYLKLDDGNSVNTQKMMYIK